MNRNSGFGVVGAILIMVTISLIGFIGWRLYDANQNKQSNSTSQASDDNQAQQSSSTPQSDQAKQTNPNEGYVVIKEWGVRFKPVDGLTGVEYFKPSDIEGDSYTFTTSAMASAATTCSPQSGNIILGLLTRNTETAPVNGGVVATINGYVYQYRGPQATCGAGDALESKAASNISASLKTLEAVK